MLLLRPASSAHWSTGTWCRRGGGTHAHVRPQSVCKAYHVDPHWIHVIGPLEPDTRGTVPTDRARRLLFPAFFVCARAESWLVHWMGALPVSILSHRALPNVTFLVPFGRTPLARRGRRMSGTAGASLRCCGACSFWSGPSLSVLCSLFASLAIGVPWYEVHTRIPGSLCPSCISRCGVNGWLGPDGVRWLRHGSGVQSL